MVLEGHVKGVLSTAFSPNGHHVATGSEDNTARVWDLRKRSCLYTLPAHQSTVAMVTTSPAKLYLPAHPIAISVSSKHFASRLSMKAFLSLSSRRFFSWALPCETNLLSENFGFCTRANLLQKAMYVRIVIKPCSSCTLCKCCCCCEVLEISSWPAGEV